MMDPRCVCVFVSVYFDACRRVTEREEREWGEGESGGLFVSLDVHNSVSLCRLSPSSVCLSDF